MDKNTLPIIGLVVAAVIAFFPADGGGFVSTADSLDKADDRYREATALIILELKEAERTEETKNKFQELLSAARSESHKEPTQEVFALWWNEKADEAVKRLRERKLGLQTEKPNSYE